jgi:intracellular sulfur oxidation DsrE/DsrF family protein
MTRIPALLRSLLAAAFIFGGLAGVAHAADMTQDFDFAKPRFAHEQPFAQVKLVLQISDDNPTTWNLVLNNAQNALEYFGQDKAHIVVVAYGPGLLMLLKNSPVAQRIAAQDGEGIEFDACHKTIEGMTAKTGHAPELVPQANVVPAGVVRIMQLQQAGFDYIRP